MQKIFSIFVVATGLLLASAVQADDGKASRPDTLSRDEAAKIAHAHFRGRLLDIRRQDKEDGFHYRVKMLEQGRVLIFNIDGKTGEIEE